MEAAIFVGERNPAAVPLRLDLELVPLVEDDEDVDCDGPEPLTVLHEGDGVIRHLDVKSVAGDADGAVMAPDGALGVRPDEDDDAIPAVPESVRLREGPEPGLVVLRLYQVEVQIMDPLVGTDLRGVVIEERNVAFRTPFVTEGDLTTVPLVESNALSQAGLGGEL